MINSCPPEGVEIIIIGSYPRTMQRDYGNEKAARREEIKQMLFTGRHFINAFVVQPYTRNNEL